MLKHNIREYELLEKDVAEIKACITRYIAYIVSVFGILVFIGKYMIDYDIKTDHYVSFKEFTPLLILAALVIITFLFEIIWYKFKSHNRHVGYQQLLAQETESYYLDSDRYCNSSKKIKNIYSPNHAKFKKWQCATTKKPCNSKNHSCGANSSYYCYNVSDMELFGEKIDIVAFKFIMSRYNDSGSITDLNSIIKSTEKAWFCFDYPTTVCNLENVKPSFVDKENKLDTLFFKNIIHKQFDQSRDNAFVRLLRGFINIGYLFKKDRRYNHRIRIDKKYLSTSWLYPRKLLQLGVVLMILMSFFFFYSLNQHFEPSFKNLSVIGLSLLGLYLWLVFRWLYKYLFQIQDLISGVGSIDYYCWAFFIYRVQYLNANNIVPKYYSRSFRRYYKSLFLYRLAETKQSYLNRNDFEHYDLEVLKSKYLKGLKISEPFDMIHDSLYNEAKKLYP